MVCAAGARFEAAEKVVQAVEANAAFDQSEEPRAQGLGRVGLRVVWGMALDAAKQRSSKTAGGESE